MIPVQRPYLGDEELEAVRDVFGTRWLGMGSTTKQFEDAIQEYLGVKHVLSVNTGTSAIHIALEGLGIGPGDDVVVPSLTFVASVQAILSTGAKPVFCDVHADTLNMDATDAAARITPKTKAIMPVHYGGLACDMDRILAIARDAGIRVVEDAAHAFGSEYRGKKIGGIGDVTCFSFDPIKNITCGEGGAVTTNDDEISARMIPKRILGIDNDTWSRYRNERNWFYAVTTTGYRYHLSNINAAIGLVQMTRLEDFRRRKLEVVRRYDEAFAGLAGLELLSRNLHETFPFFYVVRVRARRRDELMKHLKERGVGSGVHYIPNHLQPLFDSGKTSLPVTEQVFEEILTLPLFHEITDDQVETVVREVQAFFD